jgi:inner membrane protein
MEAAKTLFKQYQPIIKIFFILIMSLFLLIPVAIVKDIINERLQLRDQTKSKIGEMWGKNQTITTPILVVPYSESVKIENGKIEKTSGQLFLSSDDVKSQFNVATDTKKIGIYSSIVYTSKVNISGKYNLKTIPTYSNRAYDFTRAQLLTGLSDPASIASKVECKINGIETRQKAGSPYKTTISDGLYADFNLPTDLAILNFDIKFDLRGSDELAIIPASKYAEINIESDWANPSFSGRNLPKDKTISPQGFKAHWIANEYNSQVEDYWTSLETNLDKRHPSINAGFLQMADEYQKNMRTAKYALLIIALSFLTFFAFEYVYKKKIHPLQYSMVGIALAVFYMLLVAMTEHIGFNKGYVISAIAVISIICTYIHAIIRQGKSTIILGSILTALYTYIFVLLQLEDYALLAGAVGLFIIVAGIMYLTRNIDWYNINTATP